MGGGDKVLLPLGGGTVLDWLLARLRPQVALLALSANGDPARLAQFGVPVLADQLPDQGPLGGVAAGLAWALHAGATAVLTVPGDTPFIPMDLGQRLFPAPAWAASGGAVHPLVGLWPTLEMARLAAWLRNGHTRRVRSFGETIGMRTVQFAAQPDPFFNINTPENLAQARHMVQPDAQAPRAPQPGPDQ